MKGLQRGNGKRKGSSPFPLSSTSTKINNVRAISQSNPLCIIPVFRAPLLPQTQANPHLAHRKENVSVGPRRPRVMGICIKSLWMINARQRRRVRPNLFQVSSHRRPTWAFFPWPDHQSLICLHLSRRVLLEDRN